MKRILKFILYSPIGISIYKIVRLVYTPPIWMIKKMKFKGKFRVKLDQEKHFYLYNNAFNLETTIFWLGMDNYSWEYMTRKIWCHLCQDSSEIFDIGANTGVFAILAKSCNPRAKVVAFEPQPNIFYVLNKNCEINNFNIKCENMALSDHSGTLPFYNYGPNSFSTSNTTAGSLNSQWRTNDQSSIQVRVKSLEDYIEENGIKNIDLMKIDVETFEYEVLAGFGKNLYSISPIIILEIQNRTIGEKIESIFDLNKYSFFSIDEEVGLVSVNKLGESTEFSNYLICPNEKLSSLVSFIVDKSI